MDLSNLTDSGPWGILAAQFANPSYVNGPPGTTGSADSTGFDISSAAAVIVSFEGTYTGQTVVHEQTSDPTGADGWFSVQGTPSNGGSATSGGSTANIAYVFSCLGVRHRIRVTALDTGTLECRIRMDLAPLSSSGSGGGGGGGGVLQGAATELAPTYLEGTDDDLSLTLNGGLRVAVTDDAGDQISPATELTLAAVETGIDSLVAASNDANATNVYPLPDNPVSGLTTAMTGTTSTAVTGMGAPGAAVHNYITQVTISNTDADTGTLVHLQDGSGGTTIYTFPAPAAVNSVGVAGATFAFPTPLKQPTANTALYAVNATTGASVIVCVTGFRAP